MYNKNIKWVDEDIEKLKTDYVNKDLTHEDFELKYGRSFASIKVKARELGLKRGQPNVIKRAAYYLPVEEIKELYNQGLSTRQIAKKYNCSFPIISTILKNNGVEVKSNVEATKRYEINQDYFENIDTHEKSYFLGFIAADGYVNNKYCSLRLIIQKEDAEVLENLKKALGWSGQVKRRMMYSNNDHSVKYERVDLNIINKKIVTDLNKHGIIQCKSLVLEFPNIDEQFYSSFMRGYFDGDGSIFKRNNGEFGFNIASTEKFCQRYQEILMNKCQLDVTKLEFRNNAYCLKYSVRLQHQRIFSFLYSDNGVRLNRKYEKFKEAVQ